MKNKIRDKMNLVGLKALSLLENKKAASNVEIIVWISVVILIAVGLYLFRDAIIGFINRAIDSVNSLGTPKLNP